MRRSLSAIVILLACLIEGSAPAQYTFYWQGNQDGGAGNGTFGVADHWHEVNDQPGPPGPADLALFNYPTDYTVQMGGQQTFYTEVGGGTATFNGQYSTGTGLIGKAGSGTLKLFAGSTFRLTQPSAVALFVGESAPALLQVEGTGAKVVVDQGGVVVGNTGVAGVLTVKNRAIAEFNGPAESTAATIFGVGGGGSGTGLIEGEGSLMDIKRGGLEIGRGTTGRVDVVANGKVQVEKVPDASALLLGTEQAGDGTLVASGSGTQVIVSAGGLEAGRAGKGRVDIVEGAHLFAQGNSVRSCILGRDAGADGLLVVSGGGSQGGFTGRVDVGFAGKGAVYVTGGAVVAADKGNSPGGELALGAQPTGDGTAAVSGSGSHLLAAKKLIIGLSGKGRLDVTTGGKVTSGLTSGEGVSIGSSGGSHGELYVTGMDSLADVKFGEVVVGDGGNGHLTVSDGATLDMKQSGAALIVGGSAGADGTVEILGTGGEVSSLGAAIVGRGGKGRVRVAQGSTFFSGSGEIGGGGEGTVELDEGATWTVVDQIAVGSKSKGTLIVRGEVQNFGPIVIGRDAGSEGTLYLIDGGSFFSGSDTSFGSGSGSLILQGSTLDAENLSLGNHAGALNSIFVDASMALAQIGAKDMTLGQSAGATGQLVVENSGFANITGNLRIGAQGMGMCSIQSDGGLLVSQAIQVNQGSLTIDGSYCSASVLEVVSGSAVFLKSTGKGAVGKRITVQPAGTLEVAAGAVVGAGAVDAQQLTANAVTVGPGGVLRSSGAIKAKVKNAGGMVTVGNSPGLFTVQGDYEQTATATVHWTITGTAAGTQHSKLVANSVTLDGKVIIEFQHGFAPASGQTFDLIDATAGITLGPGLQVELRNLAPGFQYSLAVVGNHYRLTALSNATSQPSYSCTLEHVPGLYMRIDYTGILQSSADLVSWADVTGVPGSSHQIPQADLPGRQFFKVRPFP